VNNWRKLSLKNKPLKKLLKMLVTKDGESSTELKSGAILCPYENFIPIERELVQSF